MARKRPDLYEIMDQRGKAVIDAIAQGPKDDERLIAATQLWCQAMEDLLTGNGPSAMFAITDAYDLVTGQLTLEAYREYEEAKETAWRAADVVRVRTGVCPLCEENFNNAGWTTFQDENGQHLTIYRKKSHRWLARWHKHSIPPSAQ